MTFCAAPFYQLTLKPNGQAAPCCHLYGMNLGNVAQHSLAQVWNGAKLQRLRQEFISDQVKTCRGRQQELSCHRNFAHLVPHIAKSKVVDYAPKRLDLRLNGTCNLTCVMCNVWQEPRGLYQEKFWEEVKAKVAPHLESCDILGGEPFIQPDTFKMINEICTVNEDCTFAFVTNGHYPFTKKLENALRRIKLRYLQISLDSFNADTYSAIRQGSLELVLSTLNRLLILRNEHDQPFKIKASMCVLQQNWREIPQFIEKCHSLGLVPEFQYAHFDPSENSSLKYLSPYELAEVSEFLKSLVIAHGKEITSLASVAQSVEAELKRKST